MMEIVKLSAAPRPESGKGASRQLRRAGKIPAIAYGRELAATPLSISPKGLLQVLSSDHGQNAVVELAVDGGEKLTVMVRDYAYHPVTRDLLHADFVQVKLDQPVAVEVPFRTTGKAKGIVTGGILQQIFRKLPVSCLPERIPAFLEVDVTEIKQAEARALHDACHDPLTELPNRTFVHTVFEERVQTLIAASREVALLFIDLDRFKTVNDSLGHTRGD